MKVHFLYAWCIFGRNDQVDKTITCRLTAIFSKHIDTQHVFFSGHLQGFDEIWRVATCTQAQQNVTLLPIGLYLSGENLLKTEIVRPGGQYRSICSEGDDRRNPLRYGSSKRPTSSAAKC